MRFAIVECIRQNIKNTCMSSQSRYDTQSQDACNTWRRHACHHKADMTLNLWIRQNIKKTCMSSQSRYDTQSQNACKTWRRHACHQEVAAIDLCNWHNWREKWSSKVLPAASEQLQSLLSGKFFRGKKKKKKKNTQDSNFEPCWIASLGFFHRRSPWIFLRTSCPTSKALLNPEKVKIRILVFFFFFLELSPWVFLVVAFPPEQNSWVLLQPLQDNQIDNMLRHQCRKQHIGHANQSPCDSQFPFLWSKHSKDIHVSHEADAIEKRNWHNWG